jgi:hypothetical protein
MYMTIAVPWSRHGQGINHPAGSYFLRASQEKTRRLP